MNDQRFFDLAMKSIARQATDAERAELDALLISHPELKSELEKLRTDAALAKEILPLASATQSSTSEFPTYARERLQTKVRQTLGQSPSIKPERIWRWLLGLSGVAAAVVLLAVFSSRPSAPVIEVVLLDTVGAVRGSETNETSVFRRQWAKASVQVFDKSTDLDTWQTNRTGNGRLVAKVVYDRAAGEVRVTVFNASKTLSQTFQVDRDLEMALQEADKFIREQTVR